MIEMIDVSVVYPNGAVGLDQVNCGIQKGDFAFLVGPTGHGKTTLLKLIHRELLPSKGEVRVSGQSLKKLSMRQVAFLRRRIGVVFQDFRLLANRTLWENVAFALRVTGASKKQIHRTVPDLLRKVGLLHKSDALPGEVSAGEQQRAAIARALINNPPLLLADEPTGNLDNDTGWEIMKLLAEINEAGTTVVCATHNQNIVDTFRRRVIAIYKGEIVSDDPAGVYPAAVLSRSE